MKQVKFTKKYWKEWTLAAAGIMFSRCGYNCCIYSEFIDLCEKQEKLDLWTRIQFVYSKCALRFLAWMMIGLARLIVRYTKITPCVDELEDLVNPTGIPTRSLNTINKLNKNE